MSYYLKCEFEGLTIYFPAIKHEHVWTCALPMFDRQMLLKSIQVLRGLGNNLEIISNRKEEDRSVEPYTLTTLNISYELFENGECYN